MGMKSSFTNPEVVNGNCYFVSDFHLGSMPKTESDAREKRIVAWLESIKEEVQHLFFLGDIFDFWFEYRHVVPKGFYSFFAKLKELEERGVKFYFFTGNHDMWVKCYLTENFNMKIYRSQQLFLINGRYCLLGHGDGLGRGELGYKFVKKMFACPVNIFLYGLLPSSWAFGLARFISQKSRKTDAKRHKTSRQGEEYMLEYIQNFPTENPIQIFIYGHRHFPIEMKIGKRFYFNTGDWLHYDSYLHFPADGLPKLYQKSH